MPRSFLIQSLLMGPFHFYTLSLGTQQPVEPNEVQAMESVRPEGGGPALAEWTRARGTEGHEAMLCRDGAGSGENSAWLASPAI